MRPDGLTVLPSAYRPKETADRLAAAVARRGMTVLARIDHAAAAAEVGMELRPTEVIIFGNPRAGTPLMQAVQTIGIDLPLKALVWQDDTGATFLSYNDPAFLSRRHGLAESAKPVVEAMSGALKGIAIPFRHTSPTRIGITGLGRQTS